MSAVPSIFDTPVPERPPKRSPAAEPSTSEADGSKQAKKKKPSSSKKKMIDQLVQDQFREISQGADQSFSAGPSPKKGKKKNDKKKTKPALKIKLQDAKQHKKNLRKSLDAVNRSKQLAHDKSMLADASFSGETIKDTSHSTPVPPKQNAKAKQGKTKSKVMPAPINFTPSKVPVVKQEPQTPKINGAAAQQSSLEDSVDVGREKFGWVIHPTPVEEFMSNFWETKPLLIQRNDASYYKNLLSRAKIDEMLRKHNIEYTKNIDITTYREGQRETHNPDGRVLPPDMWGFYEEGCSIRMLNPQTYLHGVYEMNVKLQEFFHCMTGANFYLTPPNSQGFAPHYDDIEAFVLQVEGRKHWKLYKPRNAAEVLARVSSPNFDQEEIGDPILEVTLEPGDMLYFPRGIIHQASTVPGHHSLHVTMSVYQKNSWADLMELFLPHALAQAAENNLELRQGIPMDLHQHFGIVSSDNVTPTRKELIRKFKSMVDKIFSEEALDTAVDQLAKRFQHDALPPLVTDVEHSSTVYGSNFNYNGDGTVSLRPPFTEETKVRLLRRNVLRLVNEEDKLRVYYHTDNSREYHEYEPNFLEIDNDIALGVEWLVKIYPQSVAVADLPVDDKVEFAKSLWEKGLIVITN